MFTIRFYTNEPFVIVVESLYKAIGVARILTDGGALNVVILQCSTGCIYNPDTGTFEGVSNA